MNLAVRKSEIVKHIAQFTADLWQIHPFGEGNTRTTAVFVIKYLRSLGFDVNNSTFEKNSWYFRNALVRANYQNLQKGIYKETIHLERFFRNLLMGEDNVLMNRYLHIKAKELLEGGHPIKHPHKHPHKYPHKFDSGKRKYQTSCFSNWRESAIY